MREEEKVTQHKITELVDKKCLRIPYPLLDLDFPIHLRNGSNWNIRGKF